MNYIFMKNVSKLRIGGKGFNIKEVLVKIRNFFIKY